MLAATLPFFISSIKSILVKTYLSINTPAITLTTKVIKAYTKLIQMSVGVFVINHVLKGISDTLILESGSSIPASFIEIRKALYIANGY